MKATVLAAAVYAILFVTGVPAKASTLYDWTASMPYNGVTLTGSGQILADGNLAISMTGTYGGSSITGLAPVGSFGNNDNQIFPGEPALLDVRGITFYVSPDLANRSSINIFYYLTGYADLGFLNG